MNLNLHVHSNHVKKILSRLNSILQIVKQPKKTVISQPLLENPTQDSHETSNESSMHIPN